MPSNIPNTTGYRTLYSAGARFTTSGAVSTTYFTTTAGTGADVVAYNVNTSVHANGASVKYLDHTDLDDPTGSKLVGRLRVVCATINTAPAVNITVNLVPVTVSTATIADGTVVSGATVTLTTPGVSAFTANTSSDFNMGTLTAGAYAIVYTLSGTPSGGGSLTCELQTRGV